MKVICLFEQSGTFKNAFKELGAKAFDYDIENKFNETDYITDIFKLIDDNNLPSADLVFCFFPCTYFSCLNNVLEAKIKNEDYKKDRKEKKEIYYNYLLKIIDYYNKKNIPLIIENPYHASILYKKLLKDRNIKPTLIDNDRTLRGDYFKKPTMYYFFNLNPKKIIFFTREIPAGKIKKIENTHGFERSRISPEYARNFIKEFIEL